jgi:hypothetical protein
MDDIERLSAMGVALRARHLDRGSRYLPSNVREVFFFKKFCCFE